MISSFNEAAAVKPRKTRGGDRGADQGNQGFNEAAAVKPRKTLRFRATVATKRSCFNEAAAVKPRKTAVLQRNERPMIFVQLASAAPAGAGVACAGRASEIHAVK